jgi:hypothetical protein
VPSINHVSVGGHRAASWPLLSAHPHHASVSWQAIQACLPSVPPMHELMLINAEVCRSQISLISMIESAKIHVTCSESARVEQMMGGDVNAVPCAGPHGNSTMDEVQLEYFHFLAIALPSRYQDASIASANISTTGRQWTSTQSEKVSILSLSCRRDSIKVQGQPGK